MKGFFGLAVAVRELALTRTYFAAVVLDLCQ